MVRVSLSRQRTLKRYCSWASCNLVYWGYHRAMISRKTLFIVGAGASCEAELPSGEKLKSQIKSLLDIRFSNGYSQSSGDTDIVQALRAHVREKDGVNGSINPYIEGAWAIRDVMPHGASSIDNFLDAHHGNEKIELCGKLAIAKAILSAEKSSLLADIKHTERFDESRLAETWYMQLWKILCENVRASESDKILSNVSFITFNYDRCIERFFAQKISTYYGRPMQAGQEIVRRVPIVHVYGKVGGLPWEEDAVTCSFGDASADLLKVCKQIKTFGEGVDDQNKLAHISHLIDESEVIVFLGFAFHSMNMKLLRASRKDKERSVYSTCKDVPATYHALIRQRIINSLTVEPIGAGMHGNCFSNVLNGSCNDLFWHYGQLLHG